MGAKDQVDQQLGTKVLEKYLYQLALTVEKIHRAVVGVGTLSLRTLVLGLPILGLGVSLVAQLVKSPPSMQETPVCYWVRKIPWRRDRLPTPGFMGFPGVSDGKESTCNVGDLGSTPRLGKSPVGRHGNPLQCSCLENPHGQRSLEACSPRGCKQLDMTE